MFQYYSPDGRTELQKPENNLMYDKELESVNEKQLTGKTRGMCVCVCVCVCVFQRVQVPFFVDIIQT